MADKNYANFRANPLQDSEKISLKTAAAAAREIF